MSKNILIAEDDEDIVEILKLYLENDGFNVTSASDGENALRKFIAGNYDFVILDIMMPLKNGYELIKDIRKISDVPVLFLSAKDQDSDKIIGLNLGADDYVTKPFNPLEITARIKAQLRRYKGTLSPTEVKGIIKYNGLFLDQGRMIASLRGSILNLTPTEFKILNKLLENPGRVYTKAQIYESINGDYFENDERTMMVHISKLREKIEEDPKNPKFIITVRGIGYKIDDK